jgi:hypothetical protein
MTKQLSVLLALALLATACEKDKKNRDGTLSSSSCHYTATQIYAGAIVSDSQTVAVGTDFIARPLDQMRVILCRNADCAVTIPATICGGLPPNDPTPCQTPTPNVYVSWAPNVVKFTGAQNAHYTTYSISENLCL